MFHIIDDILTKYEGNDTIVSIPEGIKRIKSDTFFTFNERNTGDKTTEKLGDDR